MTSSSATSRSRQRAELAARELLALYRTMLRIRRVEERLSQLFADGEVPGFIHLSIGQEAIAAGVGSVLEPTDTVASTHRGHGHALAKGMALDGFFMEIMGRDTGCAAAAAARCTSPTCRSACWAPTASSAPASRSRSAVRWRTRCGGPAGWRWPSSATARWPRACCTRASTWRRCGSCRFCSSARTTAGASSRRARTSSSPSPRPGSRVRHRGRAGRRQRCRGGGAAAGRLVGAVRGAGGPRVLECITSRRARAISRATRRNTATDAEGDPERQTRWPRSLARLKRARIGKGEVEKIACRGGGADRDGRRGGARGAPGGFRRRAGGCLHAGGRVMAEIRFGKALNQALADAMAADPRPSFCSVRTWPGPAGRSASPVACWRASARTACCDTPISEATHGLGAAVGAAMTRAAAGGRDHVHGFLTLAMDALVNQAAKARFMFGGQSSVPMVLRTPHGGGLSAGPQHSQCLEAWLAHVPGLKVVCPADRRGRLRPVARRHRRPRPGRRRREQGALRAEGAEVADLAPVPIGKARTARPGRDVTIVSYGAMVAAALAGGGGNWRARESRPR